MQSELLRCLNERIQAIESRRELSFAPQDIQDRRRSHDRVPAMSHALDIEHGCGLGSESDES
ncbi:MAG: hypothetical protein KC983_00565, partial [Phycisphaerales bacterium]|nr:hypothetical protein [Phycisphaerales bacterium]